MSNRKSNIQSEKTLTKRASRSVALLVLGALVGTFFTAIQVATLEPAAAFASSTRPTGVPALTQVASGGRHVIALGKDGELYGWGTNSSRQVTGNTTAEVKVPVRLTAVEALLEQYMYSDEGKVRYHYDGAGVRIPEKIIQVVATSNTSAALTNQGRIITWGSDGYGELGRNTTAGQPGFVTKAHTNSNAVTNIFYGDQTGGTAGRIVEIAGTGWHLMARTEDGRVFSWGWNGAGNLGTGNTTSQHVPVQIPETSLKNVVKIAAGGYSSMAIADASATDSTKRVKVWGRNSSSGLYTGISTTNV